MEKYITKEEAYSLYLSEGYDNIMPFEDYKESDFIEFLSNRGLIVLDDEEIQLSLEATNA